MANALDGVHGILTTGQILTAWLPRATLYPHLSHSTPPRPLTSLDLFSPLNLPPHLCLFLLAPCTCTANLCISSGTRALVQNDELLMQALHHRLTNRLGSQPNGQGFCSRIYGPQMRAPAQTSPVSKPSTESIQAHISQVHRSQVPQSTQKHDDWKDRHLPARMLLLQMREQ